MNQLFSTSCWIHEKLWKSCQLYILNHDPQSKKIFCHTVLNYFFGEKSPTHNNVAPKLNAWGQKIGGGGGLLKPPPPDRIGLRKLFYRKLQYIIIISIIILIIIIVIVIIIPIIIIKLIIIYVYGPVSQ